MSKTNFEILCEEVANVIDMNRVIGGGKTQTMDKHMFLFGDIEKKMIKEALLSYSDFLCDLNPEEKEDFARDCLQELYQEIAKKFE